MKALTVRQPWAHLIISGGKDVENRSQRTHYRGPVAIHVSSTRSAFKSTNVGNLYDFPAEVYEPARTAWAVNKHAGHIIGTVDLIDCVRDSDSPWAFPDHWHWVLANPQPLLEPIPAKGRLGLWNWEPPQDRN